MWMDIVWTTRTAPNVSVCCDPTFDHILATSACYQVNFFLSGRNDLRLENATSLSLAQIHSPSSWDCNVMYLLLLQGEAAALANVNLRDQTRETSTLIVSTYICANRLIPFLMVAALLHLKFKHVHSPKLWRILNLLQDKILYLCVAIKLAWMDDRNGSFIKTSVEVEDDGYKVFVFVHSSSPTMTRRV